MRSHVMSPTNRALRVGVLLGGNLVEERVFRLDGGAAITFGQSLKCTLSVPAAGVPLEHTLFAVDQGRAVLRVAAGMTGRLAPERELRGEIAIENGTRGKLVLGDATILFQEIAAPPIVPRATLPASVRGTILDRIDRRLATIVAASLLVHLGIASWAWMTDREHEGNGTEAVAEYDAPKYEIMEITVPDMAEPTNGDNSAPGVAAPVAPKRQTPTTFPKQDITRLPDPVDADLWANALTGNASDPKGQTEIAKRSPNIDLDKQVQNIKEGDKTVKVGGTPKSRDGELRIGDGPDGPKLDGPKLDQVAKEEKKPKARIEPVPMPKPPGKDPLPIALVLGRIQSSYMAGLQRCYVKHGLAHDSSMVAKVTLTFTVDAQGRSTENQARGANAEVDGCIRDQMAGWRFPIPKDADGDPTDAPFKLVLALQPS
jgi:hypothetical protein